MDSTNQTQTKDSFSYKWAKRETFESEAMQKFCQEWLVQRYGHSLSDIVSLIKGKKILDAGCGAGHSALLYFGSGLNDAQYLGVDISDATEVARTRFAERKIKGDFHKCSLMEIPEKFGPFDIIFSEGVLHHTDSARAAFLKLSEQLAPGGVFMFYVYRQKAPVREFTDDYVREKISGMTNDQAWEALMPLSKLGAALGGLNIEVDVPEAIELLGIPKGKQNLQRLFYWNFCKLFYRPELSLEEMNHINFDWYRPTNCSRHTESEVREWVSAAHLSVERFFTDEAGHTVIARRGITS